MGDLGNDDGLFVLHAAVLAGFDTFATLVAADSDEGSAMRDERERAAWFAKMSFMFFSASVRRLILSSMVS
jgi:hypothetical protein